MTYVAPNRLFVQNLTDDNITFEVESAHGKAIVVNVPRSFIPVDITIFARKDDIENSQGFRSGLNGKYFKVVPDNVADKLMESPAAKAELAKLFKPYAGTTKGAEPVEQPVKVESDSNLDEVLVASIAALPTETDMVSRFKQLVVTDKITNDMALKVAALGGEHNYPLLIDEAESFLNREQ